MKSLELEQMENLQGGEMNWEDCIVAGMMGAAHLFAFGPWGVIGGFALGCAASQA